jgi:hypothetical protein
MEPEGIKIKAVISASELRNNFPAIEKMDFFEEMMEIMDNIRTSLYFPFHINHALRKSDSYYNESCTGFHEHWYHDIVRDVVKEPDAFYLTEDDKTYYSNQELEIIEKLKQYYGD